MVKTIMFYHNNFKQGEMNLAANPLKLQKKIPQKRYMVYLLRSLIIVTTMITCHTLNLEWCQN